jgi:hypothetical protein
MPINSFGMREIWGRGRFFGGIIDENGDKADDRREG